MRLATSLSILRKVLAGRVVRVVRKMSNRTEAVAQLCRIARGVRDDLLAQPSRLESWDESICAAVAREPNLSRTADDLSEAIVCGSHVAAQLGGEWSEKFVKSLCAADEPPWIHLSAAGRKPSAADRRTWTRLGIEARLDDVARELPSASAGSRSFDADSFEHFLREWNPRRRSRRGVFYTPSALASFVVRRVDETLENRIRVPGGLASSRTWSDCFPDAPSRWSSAPVVRVLDPAAGAGVFLDECLSRMQDRHRAGQLSTRDSSSDWADYLQRAMPRIEGREIMPAPMLIARLRLANWLRDAGVRDGRGVRVRLANSLLRPQLSESPFTVVIGNPPFSGVSSNQTQWIQQLLRDEDGYFEVDGRPLGERKTWLNDDYVKFFRIAQQHVTAARIGCVAFVTNHGFLDNATFRGLRRRFMRVFDGGEVVDLHGNRKNGERHPAGDRDESVFGIEQGVAVSCFFRSFESTADFELRRDDLWGGRSAKLSALSTVSPAAAVTPAPPAYLFNHHDDPSEPIYQTGFPLDEIFPFHSTAPVTARDALVVAPTREELRSRIAELVDPRVTDQQIRDKYFRRSRSTKYPPGDTRSWKLDEARQRLATTPNVEDFIRTCEYRPCDRRYVLWADWMVDWTRGALATLLDAPANLAIVARRQFPPHDPPAHIWAVDRIAIDGVIRSDNRGSESLFPILRFDGERIVANIAPHFSTLVARVAGWKAESPLTHARAGRVAAMIYAQLHSRHYRERFALQLARGFPRVFVPQSPRVLSEAVRIGQALLHLHTRQDEGDFAPVGLSGPLPASVSGRYPRFSAGGIELSAACRVAPVAVDVWESRVGSHQVCRKWLRDRRRDPFTERTAARYVEVVSRVARTRQILQQWDDWIGKTGGWDGCFGAPVAHPAF